jgi:hypothetical protein
MINYGNDPSWLGEIYNRNTEGRTGWLIFNITNAANGIGFSVSASHTSNLPATATDGLKIPAEDVSLMDDPIRTFLGWQAGKEKLFNEQLITSVIEEMDRVISKYSNSAVYANPAQAIQATQSTAQSAVPPVAPTNDPMVAALNNTAAPQQKMVQTPEQMVQNNNDPFVNPPASQFDPMAGVPNNYGQFQGQPQPQFQNGVNPQFGGANVGYTQPAFAQNAAGAQQPTSVPNPFETGSN